MSLTNEKTSLRSPTRRHFGEVFTLTVLGAALLFALQITFGFIRG